MKLYINVADYQGGSWAVGCVETLKGWRDIAMNWCDSDENWGLYNALKYYKIKNKDLIDLINDFWEINIVEFDPTNEEHLELKKYEEREVL